MTLLEVMVALTVLALAAVAVVPNLSGGRERLDLQAAVRAVSAGLRETRSRAVLAGRPESFALDPEQRSFRVPGMRPQALPSGIAAEMLAPGTGGGQGGPAVVRFFPDGGASGGTVRLASRNLAYDLNVDFLTGGVGVAPAR